MLVRAIFALSVSALLLAAFAISPLGAQAPAPAPAPAANPAAPAAEDDETAKLNAAVVELAQRQSDLADKFKRLHGRLLQMAEFEKNSNPRRATLLKEAYAEAERNHIKLQFETLIKLINSDQIGRAVGNQKDVKDDLQTILNMLLKEQRDQRLKSEQERYKEYIKEVTRLINKQRSLQGRNEQGDDPTDVADKQGELGKETKGLADKIKKNEEGGGEQNPGDMKPGDMKPGDMKPGQGDMKPGDGDMKPGQGDMKPGQGDMKPGQGDMKPGQGDMKPGQGDMKPGDMKPGDMKPGDMKPGDMKPGDMKPGDMKSGDMKPSDGMGKPSDGMGMPMDGMGKPMDGMGMGMGKGKPGEPSDSDGGPTPPMPNQPNNDNPARKRIEAAEEKMEQARQKLEKAKREESAKDQEEARNELEQAKQELERILRQLREEEIEHVLAMLEGRFKAMLEMQIKVYEDTLRLGRLPAAKRTPELIGSQTGKLSFDEGKIIIEAQKALALLREEGSSIAFPTTVEQIIADMEQVRERLARAQVGTVTTDIEVEIIEALTQMIEALQKAQRDAEQRRMMPMPPMEGQPQDEPLVDKIAELKMIKELQVLVNKRTVRYSKLLENADDEFGQATETELVDALKKLADREKNIHKITRDVVLGKNE